MVRGRPPERVGAVPSRFVLRASNDPSRESVGTQGKDLHGARLRLSPGPRCPCRDRRPPGEGASNLKRQRVLLDLGLSGLWGGESLWPGRRAAPAPAPATGLSLQGGRVGSLCPAA